MRGESMLRALDDLEKAVSRLEEKARRKEPENLVSRSEKEPGEEVPNGRASLQTEQVHEEAAELIRRAIKRLKSL